MNQAETESSKPAAAPAVPATRHTLWSTVRTALASWWGPGPAPAGHRKESAHDLAEDRTDMATSRTLMAADRTLMAWVRTSLSLSSFGFTIYKVLQGLAKTGVDLPRSNTPAYVGLFLTAMGTLAIAMGVVEYAQTIRDLRAFRDIGLWRPAFIMSILMAGMGLFLFFSIFTRV